MTALGTDQTNLTIRPVRDDDWDRLKPLWLSLYEHEQSHGMLIELPADGYELWVTSLKPVLDRFAFVFVAEAGDGIVGFVAGKIRVHPGHFGGRQVGYITELLVLDDYRERGIGDRLLSTGTHWFRERSIARFELHVVARNSSALDFYLRRGWAEEFTQVALEEPSHEEPGT